MDITYKGQMVVEECIILMSFCCMDTPESEDDYIADAGYLGGMEDYVQVELRFDSSVVCIYFNGRWARYENDNSKMVYNPYCVKDPHDLLEQMGNCHSYKQVEGHTDPQPLIDLLPGWINCIVQNPNNTEVAIKEKE